MSFDFLSKSQHKDVIKSEIDSFHVITGIRFLRKNSKEMSALSEANDTVITDVRTDLYGFARHSPRSCLSFHLNRRRRYSRHKHPSLRLCVPSSVSKTLVVTFDCEYLENVDRYENKTIQRR